MKAEGTGLILRGSRVEIITNDDCDFSVSSYKYYS
jgi:hypothetical protein